MSLFIPVYTDEFTFLLEGACIALWYCKPPGTNFFFFFFFFFLESLMATGKKGLADSSSISNAVLLKLVVCFEPGQSLSGVFISSQP